MKRISSLIVAMAAGLMVVVAGIGLLRESGLFTAPPEAVAEGFVKQLVTGHYDRALGYLDESMNREMDEEDLRHFALFMMMRSGEVIDVQGERGWVRGAKAEAQARLTTTVAGEWGLSLKMVRKGSGWLIAEIGTIERPTEGEGIFGTRIPTAIAMAGDDGRSATIDG